MGINLSILILNGPKALGAGCASGYNRLQFTDDYRILGQLTNLSSYRKDGRPDIPEKPSIVPQPIPAGMKIANYVDDGIAYQCFDGYGDPLTFVYAAQLKRELKLPSDASPRNKAIMAFVGALPEDTPLVLMWS